MNGELFLQLGEELVERRTPCDCRAAIGRAYYGVFNTVSAMMRQNGLHVDEGSAAHQKIWYDLLNCGIDELRLPGSQLGDLHGMRVKADYKMHNELPEHYQTAKFWVEEARTHLETIKVAFQGLRGSQTVAAIKQYRKSVGR